MANNIKGKEDLTRLEDMNLFEHDVSEPGPPDLPSEIQSVEASPLQEFSIEEGLPEANTGEDVVASEAPLQTKDESFEGQSSEENTEDVVDWSNSTEINSEIHPATELKTPIEVEGESSEASSSFEASAHESTDASEEQLDNGDIESINLTSQNDDASEIESDQKTNQIDKSQGQGPDQIQNPNLIETDLPDKTQDRSTIANKEDLSEVKKFATELLVGDYSVPGNPPFSIAIKNVRSNEDREDILRILKEHSLTPHQDEEQTRLALARGSLLIPQIGEYAAILLTHQLKRFQIDILIGPSSLIHTAKSYTETAEEKSGPQNLRSIKANQQYEEKVENNGHIQLTTLGHIEGKSIRYSRGPLFLHKTLGPEEWDLFENNGGQVNFFAEDIEKKATIMKANAILGVQMIFRPSDSVNGSTQITISGQAVWIE